MTRRFGPLIALVLCAYGVLVLRFAQVQLEEHEFWSSEARNLSRGSTFFPHERGRILDRDGRELVRDEQVYELEFVWRSFRRGHPLGQIAEARSLLELRTATMLDTWRSLEDWAFALVELSPQAVEDFGRGAALEVRAGSAWISLPASEDVRGEQRYPRRGHLHFYLKALLEVDLRETRALNELKDGPRWSRPYRELIAGLRGQSGQDFDDELRARLTRARRDFSRLAELLADEDLESFGEAAGGGVLLPRDRTEQLVARLEGARRRVESSAADDLFRKAAGFGAWRLDAGNLARLDLDWLRRSLFWEPERLAEWMDSRSALWPQAVTAYLGSHTVARIKVGALEERGGAGVAEAILDALADVFVPPDRRDPSGSRVWPWREVDELVVLSELARVEGGDAVPASERRGALPIDRDEFRRRRFGHPAELVGAALGVAPEDPRVEELLKIAATGTLAPAPAEIEAVAEVLLDWDARLQERYARIFDSLGGGTGRVGFVEEWRSIALEERSYVVRDRGSRPIRLSEEPGDELILLVARRPERYAGFRVRRVSERVPQAFDEGGDDPLARELIGRVRAPYIATLLRQGRLRQEFERIQNKREQRPEDGERLRELVAELRLPDEFEGGWGIEQFLDDELRGRNGFRETWGLQDLREQARDPVNVLPRAGRDVWLTLDSDLQRAAQRVLANPPELPPNEEKPDRVWWSNPIGAIVLLSPGGDVLAAASYPKSPHEPGPYQDGQTLEVRDRCFQQPRFQPPGSIFKPLVAAWALQFTGLDPNSTVSCLPGSGRGAHYGRVHCWNFYGHGEAVNLADALQGSCNSYFASLAESMPDEELRAMARAFGIGQPTGVRLIDGEERPGFTDQSTCAGALLGHDGPLLDVQRQRIGNGLAQVSASPVQMARAYAGLLTDALPRIRLVQWIDGPDGRRENRPASTPLPFMPDVLKRVHHELHEVVAAGTAKGKGLSRAELGFEIAAKTGSADYRPGMVPKRPGAPLESYEFEAGMRKHTWVAGWFPYEDPRAIFVVYLHDTSATSSHGAVYVASAFLSSPELREWLTEEEGFPLDFGGKR